MIQGSINQLISMAGVAGRLSPGYGEKAAEREREKVHAEKVALNEAQLKAIEAQEKTITADDPKTGVKFSDLVGTEQHKEYADVLGEKARLEQRRFELSPSEESYKRAKQAKGAAVGESRHYASEAKRLQKEQAEYEAQESLLLEQERLRKATGKKLLENAPAPMTGKRGTIKYGNI